jgi:uncharacterized membrane protein
MMGEVLAMGHSLARGAGVLSTLLECVFLLCLRAWARSRGVIVSRRVVLLIDTATVVFVVLFIFFVVARFEALA